MIHAKELSKRYGKLLALDRLSVSIPKGDVCGLVGPNGAGKSTFLKILATLVRPGGGKATLDGHDVLAEPDMVRGAIGYVPESFGVYEGMTVVEYLEFFAAAYRILRTARAGLINDLLELTDLTTKTESAVTSLSRGMKQRLALARSLLHDPPVLLLDEPTSGLDPRARLEFGALVRELRELGKTILVSSHLLEDLSGFCTSVMVLERGQLITHTSIGAITDTEGRVSIEAEVIDRADDAEALLAGEPTVRHLLRDGKRLRFEIDGKAEDVARLHQTLAAAVPLLWFRERQDRLLDAFLKHTKGEVM